MCRASLILVAVLMSAPAAATAQECAMEPPAEGTALTLSQPIAGSVVREFGLQYDEAAKKKTEHAGVDFEAAEGESVYAAQSGKVIAVGQDATLGNVVRIDHGAGLISAYGHLGSVEVAPGACIKSGQEIGKAGSTGIAPGPQLHFEVVRDGASVNPLDYLP